MSNFTGRSPPDVVRPIIHAALRAGPVGAERHQRGELLDRQHVGVVAHLAAVRARQVVEEQRRLQPERPVQRDRPERVRAAPRTRRSSSLARVGAPTASEIAHVQQRRALGATAGRRRARARAAGSPPPRYDSGPCAEVSCSA